MMKNENEEEKKLKPRPKASQISVNLKHRCDGSGASGEWNFDRALKRFSRMV